MRKLLVEGADYGGKSTLIARVKREFQKLGGADVKELDHVRCLSQFDRYLHEYGVERTTLFHRGHISEHVFGGIFRKERPFSERELAILNAILKVRFVVVLVEPDFGSFLSHVRDRRSDETFTEEQFSLVARGFREATQGVEVIPYSAKSREELEFLIEPIVSQMLDCG